VSYDIKKYFPYAQIREQQSLAILYALQNFLKNDKRFVIIEAGTGVGKSAIGLTVSKYIHDNYHYNGDYGNGTWYLTTQKILQDQYIKDFGQSEKMRSVKSAKNHACTSSGTNCKEGQMMLRNSDKKDNQWRKCIFECPYKKEKQEFLESWDSVANFSYFLTETNSSGKIKPRKLLVIDEAHNTESVLSNFVEMGISQYFAEKIIKVKWPAKVTPVNFVKWVLTDYYPKLQSQILFRVAPF